MCHGRNRLIFSLTSVFPGPNNLNIEIGGAGGRLKHILCNRLFYSQHRNPISNRNKNDKLGEEEKGKPPTTQNTQSHSSCKVHLGGLLELVKIAQGIFGNVPKT